mmetsp:Transcript_20656/g.24260  ORF Transcript_20656/g.24260 Transcript_20656/m.24260 type:complete len:198 (+) Transcript_20656:21-614(+)
MADKVAIPETLTFSTQEGTEYKLESALFKSSGLVNTLLQDEEGSDEIPLPGVKDSEFQRIVSYLKQNKEEPLVQIERPLKSTNLTESGVPAWANEFIKAVPMDGAIVDLIEAADTLQLNMLKSLACARVAAEIKEVGQDKLLAHYKINDELSEPDEAALKEKNEWAWKLKDEPVTEDGGDAPAADAEEAAAEGKAEE